MIKLENVNFSYGERRVLENFNLTVKNGERIALSGPSGIGKTTVLRLIMGLEKGQSGKIEVKKDAKISVVFQEDRLLPFKTVFQNLTLFGNEDIAAEILSGLGLGGTGDKYPTELSGGMARRVSIARALSCGGDIFIFDEPFNGIDEDNVKITSELINKYTKGKTVIMVSHNKRDIALLGASEIII